MSLLLSPRKSFSDQNTARTFFAYLVENKLFFRRIVDSATVTGGEEGYLLLAPRVDRSSVTWLAN